MATRTSSMKPTLGMTLAFGDVAGTSLAGIPAKVIHIWPRFRSGDYLVTLEYAQPVKFRNQFITHIDAFMSELVAAAEQPAMRAVARTTTGAWLATP